VPFGISSAGLPATISLRQLIFFLIFHHGGKSLSHGEKPLGSTAPSGLGASHYRGFTITDRHTTFGRNPLDEWSARRRDLYPTTATTHKRQLCPGGIRTRNPNKQQPKTHAIDRAATVIGKILYINDLQDIHGLNDKIHGFFWEISANCL